MKLKRGYLGFLLISLLLSSSLFLHYTSGYSSDSFAQKTGDEYIWKVTNANASQGYYCIVSDLGDQYRIQITTANQTTKGSILYDSLYGLHAIKLFNDLVWTPINTKEELLIGYNGLQNVTHTLIGGGMYIVPRNETVISHMFYAGMQYDYEHFQWDSGPHGYDGKAIGYDGSPFGDLGKAKTVIKYDVNGTIEYMRDYNGTGSSWKLVWSLDIQWAPPSEGPNGDSIPAFLFFSILAVIMVLATRQYYYRR